MEPQHDFLRRSDRVIMEQRTGITYNHSTGSNYGLVLTTSHLYCFQKGFASEKVIREIPLHQILSYEDRPLIRVIPRSGDCSDLVITTMQADEVFGFKGQGEEAEDLCRKWKGAIKERLTLMDIQNDSRCNRNNQENQNPYGYQRNTGSQSGQGYFGQSAYQDPGTNANLFETSNRSSRRGNAQTSSYAIYCPKCGFPIENIKKKGFGMGKAAVGLMFLGPVGILAGAIGSRKMICKCSRCNHEFNLDKYVK